MKAVKTVAPDARVIVGETTVFVRNAADMSLRPRPTIQIQGPMKLEDEFGRLVFEGRPEKLRELVEIAERTIDLVRRLRP